jgi:prevent-host-death family protein
MGVPESARRQLQEAKQHFSQVIREAQDGTAQVVTRHGEDVAVILGIEEYRRLTGKAAGFKEFLRAGPHFDGIDLDRDRSLPRDVDLSG